MLEPRHASAILVPLLAILAAALALSTTGRTARSQPPATETPVPPIATCIPTPTGGPTVPPGLYPEAFIEDVLLTPMVDARGCPTFRGFDLEITIGNRGVAPTRPMRMRVAGTCIGAPREVDVPEVDARDLVAVVIPGPMAKISSCEIMLMLDPECRDGPYIDRYWSGRPRHGDPGPTCKPPQSATPTSSATPTLPPSATPTSSATPTPPPIGGPRWLPFAERG